MCHTICPGYERGSGNFMNHVKLAASSKMACFEKYSHLNYVVAKN